MHNLMKAAGALALLVVAGCATWRFEPLRTQKYVDNDNNFTHVDYGVEDEPRESWFNGPRGVRMKFRSKLKVRVELPDGTCFVAYQRMSTAGRLYKTEDDRWEYFEQGVACLVAELAEDETGYLARFQGVLCGSSQHEVNRKKEKIRSSSTPQGFGRDSSGPRDSNGPTTVKE